MVRKKGWQGRPKKERGFAFIMPRRKITKQSFQGSHNQEGKEKNITHGRKGAVCNGNKNLAAFF